MTSNKNLITDNLECFNEYTQRDTFSTFKISPLKLSELTPQEQMKLEIGELPAFEIERYNLWNSVTNDVLMQGLQVKLKKNVKSQQSLIAKEKFKQQKPRGLKNRRNSEINNFKDKNRLSIENLKYRRSSCTCQECAPLNQKQIRYKDVIMEIVAHRKKRMAVLIIHNLQQHPSSDYKYFLEKQQVNISNKKVLTIKKDLSIEETKPEKKVITGSDIESIIKLPDQDLLFDTIDQPTSGFFTPKNIIRRESQALELKLRIKQPKVTMRMPKRQQSYVSSSSLVSQISQTTSRLQSKKSTFIMPTNVKQNKSNLPHYNIYGNANLFKLEQSLYLRTISNYEIAVLHPQNSISPQKRITSTYLQSPKISELPKIHTAITQREITSQQIKKVYCKQ